MEHRVLELLLEGEDQRLSLLRAQLRAAVVARREFTGVDFFTHLSVPADVQRAEGCARLVLGDLYAEVAGLEHPAGFLLFVTDGALDCLECFIADDRWPETATLRRPYYVHPAAAGSNCLVGTEVRDLEWALRDAV